MICQSLAQLTPALTDALLQASSGGPSALMVIRCYEQLLIDRLSLEWPDQISQNLIDSTQMSSDPELSLR